MEQISKLMEFSRDWRSSEDFPTVETNEERVREDMQALHDEMKDYINSIFIPFVQDRIDQLDSSKATHEEVSGITLGSIPELNDMLMVCEDRLGVT